MSISDHIELIQIICKTFGWKTNRLRQFRRAGIYSREIEAHLNLTLIQLNIK